MDGADDTSSLMALAERPRESVTNALRVAVEAVDARLRWW
jgi:hypothetical protein